MNWDQIRSNWKQVSGKIRLNWGRLSEDDLVAISGNLNQLTALLQKRYGYEKAYARIRVDEFTQKLKL